MGLELGIGGANWGSGTRERERERERERDKGRLERGEKQRKIQNCSSI
jgi:hypothetical protein